MALVSVEEDGAIGTITLDHPDKRNALGEALIADLEQALDRLRERSIRAVVLRARPGVKVWSAGHDVDELPTSQRDPLGWSYPLRSLVRRLQEFPAPVIAQIEGGVWGGACEVAFACDLINATPDASFAITPARLGVPYNVTGLKSLVAALGVERLYQLGAINHIVPADRISAFTVDLARTIAANASLTIAAMKESLRILADAHSLAPTQFERLQDLRRKVGESHDYREGLQAFAEKRPPVFRGE